jgi:flagellar basal body rod protein FlgC
MDANAIALSGIRSAELRMAASAHNVANLSTEPFRPLRVVQSALPGGGVTAHAEAVPIPEEVDLAAEVAAQIEARTQFIASLRALAANRELQGSLLDLFA